MKTIPQRIYTTGDLNELTEWFKEVAKWTAKYRRFRLEDFAARKAYAPEDIYRVEPEGWEYKTVHPMANETEILQRLNIKPEDCQSVDCYWKLEDDVFFLQTGANLHFPPEYFARKPDERKGFIDLYAVLNVEMIAEQDLVEVMRKFAPPILAALAQTKK